MSLHQTIIDASELSSVSFQCDKCKTEVLFDLNAADAAPYICPTCHTQYAELGKCFIHLRDFYRLAAAVPSRRIRFRIPANA